MSGGAKSPVVVRLKKPVERSVAHGHPWIFRDALEHFEAEPGTVVTVLDRRGKFLARGLAEGGPIGVRVWSRRDRPLDEELLRARVAEALALRARHAPPETDALRLIHGEGDRMPGFVLDRYGDAAVLRLDGQAAARWRTRVIAALIPALEAEGVSTLLVRRGGKAAQRNRGAAAGGPGTGQRSIKVELAAGTLPTELLEVREHGMRLPVDLLEGQKTGLFLDHRDSRFAARAWAAGQRVLNLYGYTGGFSISAGLGGASHVTTVDVAPRAIALAEEGWRRNGLDPALHAGEAVDAESFLERARSDRRRWDLVISDPPSFAPSEASKPAALKAYKALHRACLEVVAPGGRLLAASCSSHVHRPDFEQTLREAGHGARRHVQVLARWGAGFDHPVPLGFPEGEYLTVTLCRVLDP